ncbi:hypothetical protein CH275_10245 [Rhodococcus sp. 06-235-1A]|uniref:carotenoid oxygenase family protein n=1 Tax=Rhodococcus sp. 06-235-1A TaxID=2022508 RepID=UPI000B9B77BD|nr:carotenoid oxygenase family protein [Rhodococcus sp. 06-235-1A]OZD06580.1 hypothetical protein CH275_10245 [Rhodococcus sp. 06-235-1A]
MVSAETRTHNGTDTASSSSDHRQGFASMEDEVRVDSIPVHGDIPEWLTGRLIRVTPALLDYQSKSGVKTMGHWFDGLSMLNCFSFQGGRVSYASKFLETNVYKRTRQDKELHRSMSMGTDPCRTLGKRIMSLFVENDNSDNPNINVTRMGERYFALTETPIPMEFDPETLGTLGPMKFEEDVSGQYGPISHAHYDRESGDMIATLTQVGLKSTYNIHKWGPNSTKRELIASVPTGGTASYMHSFAVTENYVVLTAQPLSMNLAKFIRTGKGVESLSWDSGGVTDFIVVNRHDGELIGRFEAEPFFFFHHCNAYESGSEIHVDVVAMNDPASIWSLQIDKLRDPHHNPRFHGELRRYTVSLDKPNVTVKSLSASLCEFPRINYAHCNGLEYSYAFATAYETPNSKWFDQLVKIDVTSGNDKVWSEAACFPGEPVYVARPGATAEDDGVILSVVLDTRIETSYLLVLDAHTFTEIARAQAPHHIGFNFHGDYFA